MNRARRRVLLACQTATKKGAGLMADLAVMERYPLRRGPDKCGPLHWQRVPMRTFSIHETKRSG